MALSCGIVGLPTVGKTTFFNLLTNANIETSAFYSGKTATNINTAQVPDERVDFLSAMFHPKKTTYAQIEVIDVPGLVKGSSQGQGTGNEFLSAVRDADALVHIVRAFENKQVLHVDNSLDIMRDLETVNMELLFSDLQLIETRLARINSGKKKKMENPLEETVLMKIQEVLENEQPVSTITFSEEEKEAILDLCESVLYSSIKNGDTQSAKWVLATKGKERGFIERREVTGENGAPLVVKVELIGDEDTEGV